MTVQMPISARAFALVFAAFCFAQIAAAQTRPGLANAKGTASAQAGDAPPPMSVVEWLQRMHTGARQRNYIGTFVVSVPCVRLRTVARIAPAGIAAASKPVAPASSAKTCSP